MESPEDAGRQAYIRCVHGLPVRMEWKVHDGASLGEQVFGVPSK